MTCTDGASRRARGVQRVRHNRHTVAKVRPHMRAARIAAVLAGVVALAGPSARRRPTASRTSNARRASSRRDRAAAERGRAPRRGLQRGRRAAGQGRRGGGQRQGSPHPAGRRAVDPALAACRCSPSSPTSSPTRARAWRHCSTTPPCRDRPPVATATPRWPCGANVDLTDSLNATRDDTATQRANLEAKQRYQQQLTEVVADKRVAVDEAADAAAAALVDVKGDLAELVAAEQQRKIAEAARQQQEADPAPAGRGGRRRGSRLPRRRHRPPARAPAVVGAAAPAAPRAAAPPARAVPPPSPGAAGAVAAAMSQVGVGYRYASAGPGRGLRLLRPHQLGLGAGRRRPAAQQPGPVRRVAARAHSTSSSPATWSSQATRSTTSASTSAAGRWCTPADPGVGVRGLAHPQPCGRGRTRLTGSARL